MRLFFVKYDDPEACSDRKLCSMVIAGVKRFLRHEAFLLTNRNDCRSPTEENPSSDS